MKKYITGLLLVAVTYSNGGELVVKSSPYSVDETVEKMKKIIASKAKEGLKVFTVIDHQAAAGKHGLKMLPEKVVLFGNPGLGTKMMQKDPKAGLDLPLRVLVYEDAKGRTKIVYRDPEEWQKGFDLQGCKLLPKMTKVLDMVTTEAAK